MHNYISRGLFVKEICGPGGQGSGVTGGTQRCRRPGMVFAAFTGRERDGNHPPGALNPLIFLFS